MIPPCHASRNLQIDNAVVETIASDDFVHDDAKRVRGHRHADNAILRGITRTVLFDAIKAEGLTVEERAFTLEEAYRALEAFITSASQIVLPVVRVDDRIIGDGKPGPVAIALRRAYHSYAEAG